MCGGGRRGAFGISPCISLCVYRTTQASYVRMYSLVKGLVVMEIRQKKGTTDVFQSKNGGLVC